MECLEAREINQVAERLAVIGNDQRSSISSVAEPVVEGGGQRAGATNNLQEIFYVNRNSGDGQPGRVTE